MKLQFFAFWCVVLLSLPVAGYCAGSPPSSLAGFHQPVARCVAAGTIITMAGKFQIQGEPAFEVVATAKTDGDIVTDTSAVLDIFDPQCSRVFNDVFPGSSEVSFETLHWNGMAILHYAVLTNGADSNHFDHYFLTDPYGPPSPLPAAKFEEDNRLNFIAIGPLGPGRGFGVTEILLPNSDFMGTEKHPETYDLIYTWRNVVLPNGRSVFGFQGPIIVRDGTHGWSVTPNFGCDMGFPLSHYLYGAGCGG